MPSTPTNTTEANAQLDAWKSSMTPEEYSSSKKVNKVVNWLKSQSPGQFDVEAGGGLPAQIQRGVEDPTAGVPGVGAGAGFAGGGLGNLPGSSAPGGVDLQSIYDTASNTPEILGLQGELEAKKAALTTALTNINDNPFYSEATRTGRVAKLKEQAGREIQDIEDMLNTRKADAQVKVNIATQQYNIDDNNYKNNVAQLNLLISSGAIANASAADIAQIALATGISTDMVKGIIDSTIKGQENLQIATNDNGDVTIYDLNTGEVRNTIRGIGNQQLDNTDDGNKEVAKLANKAKSFFKDVDKTTTATNPNAEEDKLLSSGEQYMILQRIMELVGNDEAVAEQVFKYVWNTEGYENYGE